MKTKQILLNLNKLATYVPPDLEVINIRLEQYVLANGSGTGSNESLNDMEKVYW